MHITTITGQTLLASLFLFALVLLAGRIRQLPWLSHGFWVSLAGGGSISYVFLQILPKLAASDHLLATTVLKAAQLNYHAFFLALVGLLAFQGVERLYSHAQAFSNQQSPPKIFWIRTALFAHYNILIGYLLYYQATIGGVRSLLLYTLAISLHFLVIDSALFSRVPKQTATRGRWLLGLGLLLGWTASTLGLLSLATLAAMLALLAGAMILNVLNEELSASRQGHFGAFTLGALLYSLILMAF